MQSSESALSSRKHCRRLMLALCLTLSAAPIGQSAVTISFEASEGFPSIDATPFQGTSAPAGVVDLWSIAGSVLNLQIDEGPGGGGALPEPSPTTGTQQALVLNSGGGELVVTMDLNNSQAYSLTSFQYANRGTYPPEVIVEYYDLNENLIGSTKFRKPNPNITGSKGVGLDAAFNPVYQLLTPGPLFQDVPLSKLVFRGVPPNAGSMNGRFYLDDIVLSPNSTGAFNPSNYARVSFETSEGFGGNVGDPIIGVTIPNLIDAFIDNNNESYTLGIQHGYNVSGFGPLDLDDPVEGKQYLHVNANGDPDGPPAILEVDLTNAAEASLASFWYSYRGNFADQTVTIEYFDLNEQSLGIETFSGSPDGGQALGMDQNYEPDFDLIVVGQGGLPGIVGTPMSRFIITSNHNHPDFQFAQAMFGIDELRFSLGGAPPPPIGDYNGDGTVDAADYVVWRKTMGDTTSYNVWKSNFGNFTGGGSALTSSAPVPEPTSGSLALFAVLCLGMRRLRWS